jgi:predicted DNA-binding antitoxin AbrB/MazE fold protein
MTRSIQAVYQNGVLRPLEPLNLSENERVTVIIDSGLSAANGASGPAALETPLSDEEFHRLLDELASGPPLPHLPADVSRVDVYADHD